jgi:26S proteasome regulatory subunit N3
MGRVQAIQLEYSDSYQRLMMAARKAPQDCAPGFTCMVYRLAVLVQLLMGDIPERSIFNQAELRTALHPYLFLTQAVRNGSIQKFNEVVDKYGPAFKADKNHTLGMLTLLLMILAGLHFCVGLDFVTPSL